MKIKIPAGSLYKFCGIISSQKWTKDCKSNIHISQMNLISQFMLNQFVKSGISSISCWLVTRFCRNRFVYPTQSECVSGGRKI